MDEDTGRVIMPGMIVYYARRRMGRTARTQQQALWMPMIVTHVHGDGKVDGVMLTAIPQESGLRQVANAYRDVRQGDAIGCWKFPWDVFGVPSEDDDGGELAGHVEALIKTVADQAKTIDALAERLSALETPAEKGSEEDASTSLPNKPSIEERLVEAVRGLDRTKRELWTQAGLPKVEVLEAIIGEEITAGQRDAAHAVVEAERTADTAQGA